MSQPSRPPQGVLDTLKLDVIGYLGGGAYKSVWAAVMTETGLDVALLCEDVSPQQEIEHSVTDYLISSPLHPNIIGPPVGSNGQAVPRLLAHGIWYTILERCHTELFDQLAEHGGSVPEPVSREFFVQTLAGLRFMHANGVAHRDIKLENLMVLTDGRVKYIDFGLAYVADMPAPAHLPFSFAGSRGDVGTRSYLAPEVATSPGAYDAAKADIWSLGCTLFALVAGFFVVDRAMVTDPRFVKMQQAEARGQSKIRRIFGMYNRPVNFSDELVELLDGMLTIDPANRWTLERILNSTWCSEAYAPHLANEPLYRTERLNRKRASERWGRLIGASQGFGRALLSFRQVFSEVTYRPGNQGAMDVSDEFRETAAELDAMPIARQNSGAMQAVMDLVIPNVFRSGSNMSVGGMSIGSDDEMGPPQYRSLAARAGDIAGDLVDAVGGGLAAGAKGLGEAIVVMPPAVTRQRAQRDVFKGN